jgi:hypothetical protein
MRMNTEQASKCRRGSRLAITTRKADAVGEASEARIRRFHRGSGDSTQSSDQSCNKGSPWRCPAGKPGNDDPVRGGIGPTDGGWGRSSREAG